MAWTDIPADMLDDIANRLGSYKDYRNCRAVCKAWELALPKTPREQKLCQTPWMVIPFRKGRERCFCLVNLSEKKIYNLNFPPESKKIVVRGSCSEWLFIIKYLRPYLLNPFTGNIIDLPRLTDFADARYVPEVDVYCLKSVNGVEWEARDYIRKVIVCRSSSSNIGKDGFVVVVIYSAGSQLACSKPGDKRWTKIPMPITDLLDAVFHKGSLYVVNMSDQLAVVNNIMGSWPRGIEVNVEPPQPETPDYIRNHVCLVSSEHDLFLVEMSYHLCSRPPHYDTLFTIFKLDGNKTTGTNWSMVNNLGGQVLLLESHSSLLLPCHIFPGSKANCIYYDFNMLEPVPNVDVRVFHLDNANIEEKFCDKLRTLDLRSVSRNMISFFTCGFTLIWLLSDLATQH